MSFLITPQYNQLWKSSPLSLKRVVSPFPHLYPQHHHPSQSHVFCSVYFGLWQPPNEERVASSLSSLQSVFYITSSAVILKYILAPLLRNDRWLSIAQKIKSTIIYVGFLCSSHYCLHLFLDLMFSCSHTLSTLFVLYCSKSPDLDRHSMLP